VLPAIVAVATVVPAPVALVTGGLTAVALAPAGVVTVLLPLGRRLALLVLLTRLVLLLALLELRALPAGLRLGALERTLAGGLILLPTLLPLGVVLLLALSVVLLPLLPVELLLTPGVELPLTLAVVERALPAGLVLLPPRLSVATGAVATEALALPRGVALPVGPCIRPLSIPSKILTVLAVGLCESPLAWQTNRMPWHSSRGTRHEWCDRRADGAAFVTNEWRGTRHE